MEQHTFTETHEFCIKGNNAICRMGCIICGNSFKPDAPFWIGLDGLRGFVCDGCCEKEAPHLMAAARLANFDDFIKGRCLTDEEVNQCGGSGSRSDA